MGEATVVIHGDGEDTRVSVKTTVGGILATQNVPHDEMTKIFLQWLRELPSQQQMLVIAGIVLEHQVSYHLNAKSEEEHLQALNMEEDTLVEDIMDAVKTLKMSQYPGGNEHVEISSIYELLKAQGRDLPSWVVYSVLKGIEYADGRIVDIGEGFFSVRKPL